MTAPADTPADAEALLVHAPFLRALARSLLGAGHPDEPDDVVQEAYLRATERPPRDVEAGRGWLATTVRRLVAERGRREPRRARWEAAAARRDAVPSTERIVQREAVRRRVVDAVVALDEPYRSAILLRFYEDLPPREIAARLDVPVETVRTRVKRGLAQLRGRLDELHGGDRRAWGALLAPLAWPTRAKAAGLPWPALSPKAVIAVGLAVVAGFTLWQTLAPRATVDEPASATLVAAGETLVAAPLAAEPDDGAPAPRPLDVAGPGARLTFDVADTTGAPLADHLVALTGCPVPEMSEAPTLSRTRLRDTLETRTARTTSTGRATFAGVPQGVWAVTTAPAPGGVQGVHGLVVALDPGMPAAVFTGAVRSAVARAGVADVTVDAVATDGVVERGLTAPAHARIAAGRTLDVDGAPVAGADVVVLPDALARAADELGLATIVDAFAPTLTRVSTDADGHFDAPLPGDDARLRAASARHLPAVVEPAPAPRDTAITLRRRVGFSLAGRVVDADGTPIADALVALSDVAPVFGDHDAFVDNVRRFGKIHATTDADGRFAFTDVRHLAARDGEPTAFLSETDPMLMVCASAPGRLPGRAAATITDGTTDDVVVELVRGGEMTVRVDVDQPGASIGVSARGPGSRTFASTLRGPDHACTFFRVPHGTWRFVVENDLQQSDEIEVDWRGGDVVLRPTFTRPTWVVDVELLGASDVGTPQEREAGVAPTLGVTALRAPPSGLVYAADMREHVEDREALVFGRDWDDVDEAWIVASYDGEVLDTAHVRRGDTYVTLDVTAARSTRGGFVVDVTELSGASGLSTPRVLLYAPGAKTPTMALRNSRTITTSPSNTLMSLFGLADDDERTWEVWGRVAPGRYDVVVRPITEGMSAAYARDVVVVAGGVTRVEPEPLPTTQVLFSTPGAEGRAHRFALFDADGRRWVERADADAPFSVFVPPGRYTVHAMTRDGRAGRATFVVDGGLDVRRIEIPMAAATPTTVTVTPTTYDDGTRLRVVVSDDVGRVVADRETRVRDGNGAPFAPAPLTLSLPVGAYTATLEIDGVETERTTITPRGMSPTTVVLGGR